MSRLPVVGADANAWGSILNDFLGVSFNSDGTLKASAATFTVINVKDPAYGATGDGTTDDTTAIRSAVAAAQTAGGGVVYFPPGTYRLNPTTNGVIGTAWNFSSAGGDWYTGILITANDITLLGTAGASTLLMSATTTGTRCNSLIGILGTSGTPVYRTAIHDLAFNLQNQNSSVVLYSQYGRDISFVRNKVRNNTPMLDTVTLDNTVSAVIASNNFRDCGIATGLYEASNVAIIGNSYYNVNEALDADKPVTSGTGTAGHNISIIGNVYDRDTVDTTGDAAWELDGYTDVTITGNTIRLANNGIDIVAKARNGTNYPAQRYTITGNTVQSVNNIGIAFGDVGENTYVNHEDITVADNVINGSGSDGIRVRGSRVIVRGNHIRTAGAIGINGVAVAGNNLTGFVISGNHVTNCVNEGIYLDTVTDGSVTGNTVTDNLTTSGNAQIYIQLHNNVAISGNMTSGTASGIRTFGGSGESAIVGNFSDDTEGVRWQGAAPQKLMANFGLITPGATSTKSGIGGVVGFSTGPGGGSEVWGTGDILYNVASTVGGLAGSQYIIQGWYCTSGGTPGTWVEMRTLTGT